MAWHFSDTSFCDEIIEYYETQKPIRGICGDRTVDLSTKDSYDVPIGHGDHANKYFSNLQKCVESYIAKYNFCNAQEAWTVHEDVNIQKYLPNGAYHAWHCERDGCTPIINSRHLVFMTYLNDVTDSGETEFFYQGLKLKPKKGDTVIWPSDWTFTHRGVPSPTQEKMIVTGWFSYTTPNLWGA